MKITINPSILHSTADIITNSSTEVFISADNNTKTKIIQLVDSLFEIGGSNKKFEDVFDFSWDLSSFQERAEDEAWYKLSNECKNEIDDTSEEFVSLVNEMLEEAASDDFEPYKSKYWQPNYDSRGPERGIIIKVKEGLSTETSEQAAKLLSNLTSFFNIEAYQNY